MEKFDATNMWAIERMKMEDLIQEKNSEMLPTATMWKHDIALIKLNVKVPASAERVLRIQAVTLPNPEMGRWWPLYGQECVVKGWGCTTEGLYLMKWFQIFKYDK